MTGRINYSTEAQQQLNELNESSAELVVNILGVFSGGQDWRAALGEAGRPMSDIDDQRRIVQQTRRS